jgi:hypothetical protein
MRFIEALGRQSSSGGRVYIVGGGSAVLYGWRTATVDVDVKLDPEPVGAFEAIRQLKDELGINVELASPDLFIPELPAWRERSVYIGRFGQVDFYHYDFYAQALAKVPRMLSGHRRGRLSRQGRSRSVDAWFRTRRPVMTIDPSLPGSDIVLKGLDDLAADRLSPEALVVIAAAPRLRRLGIDVPERHRDQTAELELYELLGRAGSVDPYSAYNALLRSVVSFAAALEHRTSP